jgi:hypothetical protein
MTSAADFNSACGHVVPPGAQFCPRCGQPIETNRGRESVPVVAASADLPQQPTPPKWPWEINDDDELHAVQSDPTVVPPYYRQPDQETTGPQPKGPKEPPSSGRRRSLLMIVGAVAIVVIAAVGVVLATRHPGNTAASDASSTHPATRTAAPTPKPSTSPAPNYSKVRATPEGKAATALAALLARSVLQLGNVNGATANVEACGKNLRSDEATFNQSADNRRAMVTGLADLSGRSALPSAMLEDLNNGWQASVKEYLDLGYWANDEVFDGCTKSRVTSDNNYRTATGLGGQATNAKKEFLALWGPIAHKYGYPTYEYWQL